MKLTGSARIGWLCLIVAATIAPSGCSGDKRQATDSSQVPSLRNRPLRLPVMKSGCPATTGARKLTPGYAPAVGKGPIYVETGGFEFPAIPFAYPSPRQSQFYGSKWGGQILKLIGSPTYRGVVLIRGRQLDGPNLLRFGTGPTPLVNLRLPPGIHDPRVGRWAGWGNYLRLRVPGCYGMQIDGTSSSETVVFRAERVRHPFASP
jgi:hypothetical protein